MFITWRKQIFEEDDQRVKIRSNLTVGYNFCRNGFCRFSIHFLFLAVWFTKVWKVWSTCWCTQISKSFCRLWYITSVFFSLFDLIVKHGCRSMTTVYSKRILYLVKKKKWKSTRSFLFEIQMSSKTMAGNWWKLFFVIRSPIFTRLVSPAAIDIKILSAYSRISFSKLFYFASKVFFRRTSRMNWLQRTVWLEIYGRREEIRGGEGAKNWNGG